MRNLAHIGFEVNSLEEFQALAEMAYKHGNAYRAGRTQYYCYHDQSGAELWVQVDENDEIAGMNCHFRSLNVIDVNVLHAQAHEDRPLDGTLEAQVLHPASGLPATASLPKFAFDLPDAHLVPQIAMPARGQVQLAAFARDVHVYETVEDYRKTHPGIPLEGLQPIAADQPHPGEISSLMRLHGMILQATQLHNAYSGRDFYWLELKTAIGKVDVLAATRSLPFLPSQGQIFDGDVRLSGRMTFKDAVAQKPGILERLFWGAASNHRS